MERTLDPTDALMRIPMRAISVRDSLMEFNFLFAKNELDQKNLKERSFSVGLDKIFLLESANSFKKDVKTEFTRQWAALKVDPINPWYLALKDDNYKWWQMTEITPRFEVGEYKLVCVERNSQNILISRNYSSNKDSSFAFVLVKQKEIDLFKNDAMWVNGHFQI